VGVIVVATALVPWSDVLSKKINANETRSTKFQDGPNTGEQRHPTGADPSEVIYVLLTTHAPEDMVDKPVHTYDRASTRAPTARSREEVDEETT
jgi:hypothetical protein